jgi:hypothetical protein
MTDLNQLNRQKERMLNWMKVNGPSLPVQLAKAIGVSPLFASAFLSELKGEGKVKISRMRVGSSPLYYLEGQEEQLEKFIQHFESREREAFSLLKESRILEDSIQSPVVRVALRSIRDFAIPVKINVGGEMKLFWRYFNVLESEVGGIVRKGKKESKRISEDKKELAGENATHSIQDNIGHSKDKDLNAIHSPTLDITNEKTNNDKTKSGGSGADEQIVKVSRRVKKKEESEFGKKVREYLAARDIEVMSVVSDKKREFVGKVRHDSVFGKQEYYLVAKDKKSVGENDLTLALQKAQGERVPALVMATGDLNKKGKEHLGSWKGLVKWEKLEFRTFR